MKNLKEELKKMTGKDVVLAMVRGLEKEHVKVDMDWFGRKMDGICFGCAATNAICEITDHTFDISEISAVLYRADALNINCNLLYSIEGAIDQLRLGKIYCYNIEVIRIGFNNLLLPIPETPLPELTTGNYKENLIHYVTYANSI